MATFNTIWSIDLGKSSLKAVKLRREKNNVEILAIDKIDYPIGANGVDAVQQAREALGAFRSRNEVREPVVVAHPGQGTFSRFIKVPAFEAKKLKEMVGYEASQQIPFPLEEVIWDYHLINRDYGGGEEREVGIFAVRREAIDDYLLDFTSEGLSVEVLSIGYLGLLNYIHYDLAPPEPSIFLDIGATHTDLILVDGKRFWIRALPHSGNDVNKAIMERFKVSFQEAERLKIESGKAPQQAVKIFSAVIQPKLKELVGEIHRSVGYYRSQAGEVKFQNLYLLGNGSRVVGIKKYLAEQLGVQVHRVQSLHHFRISREVDLKLLQNELPAFATAFGCALQGVGAGTCRVDLVPQEERLHKEVTRKKKHAFIGMAAVYLTILLAWWMLDGQVDDARQASRSNQAFLKQDVEIFAREEEGKDPVVLARAAEEIRRIGELRNLFLIALRGLGAVVPDNSQPLEEVAESKYKDAVERDLKIKLAELNKKKLWIPWITVRRIEWPEDTAAAAGPGQKAKDVKKVPTVPAYKFTVFAAVAARDTSEASLEDVRKLLEEPLERRLKEDRELTIDPDVRISPEYVNNIMRLDAVPRPQLVQAADRGGPQSPAQRRRVEREDKADTPQEAGPFFGTQVSWYLRLREPPKEELPLPGSSPEDGGDEVKKTGKKKTPKGGKKK